MVIDRILAVGEHDSFGCGVVDIQILRSLKIEVVLPV